MCMRRKIKSIFDKETIRFSQDSKSNLNLTKLNQDNRKLIRLIYKNLLINQQKQFKQVPSINSLSGYQENLPSLKSCQSQELDRISIILVDDKLKQSKAKKYQPFEQKRQKMEQLNELYTKKVEPIQKELMPLWSKVESDEKQNIIDLYVRWQNCLENSFNRLKIKQKSIRPVFINHQKLIQKGIFNFEANLNNLKKIQIDLLEISSQKDQDENLVRIEPNTRILLKCFKEFMNAFESIEMAKQNIGTNLYWSNLKSSITHLSKSILRCAFYVHENANLYKAPIGLPPIYVLESDDLQNQIKIQLESLYHYAFLCINKLNVSVTKNDIDTKQQAPFISTLSKRERKFLSKNNKQKFYKLILKCLIKLIQLCVYIRETIIMKQIRFENENLTECDLYGHFVSNECNLIREYLKEIILDKI